MCFLCLRPFVWIRLFVFVSCMQTFLLQGWDLRVRAWRNIILPWSGVGGQLFRNIGFLSSTSTLLLFTDINATDIFINSTLGLSGYLASSLFRDVSVLFWCCLRLVSVMSWSCLGRVSVLSWSCLCLVSVMSRWCFGDVSVLVVTRLHV